MLKFWAALLYPDISITYSLLRTDSHPNHEGCNDNHTQHLLYDSIPRAISISLSTSSGRAVCSWWCYLPLGTSHKATGNIFGWISIATPL